MEILSPVKNFENCVCAVMAGADAIYFSGDKFGARASARNSEEEVVRIVEFAKSHYVKTYVTLNTLIMNSEIDTFIEQVNFFHRIGIDAVILQDFSMISVVKSMFPLLEVHCSTQMNVGNSKAAFFVKELGASRIVVPRELSLKQIENLTNLGVETEVFVHGALCTSYSGVCLISSILNKNSGNRGRCNQVCRMPLELYKDGICVDNKGEFLLSLRDLNVSDNIKELEKINVSSLKIEGRLKQKDYVGLTTYTYKSLLDKNLDNELHKVYNREFTRGYIFEDNSNELRNMVRVNNNGYYVGDVTGYKNGWLTIKTVDELHHLDKIRFVNKEFETGQVIDVIEKIENNVYKIKSKFNNVVNSKVYVVSNYKIANEKYDYYSSHKKKYDVNIELEIGKRIVVTCEGKTYYSNQVLEQALKKPLSKEDIIKQFSKTKDYPFDFNITIDYCEGFISLKALNEIRRAIYEDITKEVLRVEHQDKNFSYKSNKSDNKKELYIEVLNKSQIDELVSYKDKCILVVCDNNLYEYAKQQEYICYFKFPTVIEDEYTDCYNNQYDGVIISELGGLGIDHSNKLGNYTLNTTNVVNQEFLKQYVDRTILSQELCYEDLSDFDLNNAICFLYGKIELMTMKYCLLNENKMSKCGKCNKCKTNNFSIKYNNEYYSLKYTDFDKLSLMMNKPIYNKGLLNYDTSYYIRFSDEENVLKLLDDILSKRVKDYIDNYKEKTK